MKLNKKWFWSLGPVSAAVVAPVAISAGCHNSDDQNKIKDLEKKNQELQNQLDAEKNINSWSNEKKAQALADLWKTADKAQKYEIVKQLDWRKELTDDQRHEVINQIDDQAGNFAAGVWYITSVESKLAKEQAYGKARASFNALMARTADNFDYSQNFNDQQQVNNPAAGKSIPVIFMDIDETVLQNDFTEVQGWLNGGYNAKVKEENDLKANRFAVPGAVEFINYVQSKGALVVYNSDMNQSTLVRNAVKENLQKVGIKFIADFQFWMRGSMPYLAKNKDDITDEKTQKMDKNALKDLAAKTTFTDQFNPTPWKTWTNSLAAYNLGKLVLKNERMNGLDANLTGWNFTPVDGKSGDKVIMKTVMKIGDNIHDFFDSWSKSIGDKNTWNQARNEALAKPEMKWFHDLFVEPTATGYKYAKNNGGKWEFTKLAYHQSYVMVPGNCEYGSWNEQYGFGKYIKLYNAIKTILANPKYTNGPSAENNVI